MSAKKFFYVCAGLLTLVIAYSVGARSVRADFESTASPIMGLSDIGFVLRSDGTVWELLGDTPPRWIPVACGSEQIALPPSVHRNEVLFWDHRYLITTTGIGWYRSSCNQWASAGQIPLPSVNVQRKAWSGVKEGYRK